MRVSCKSTEGFMFSVKDVRNGNETKTHYNGIRVNNSYNVYGMILYKDGLKYLIYDEFEMANWYPTELFDIIDSQLPQEWFYEFYGYDEYLSAIWGYQELVQSEEHYSSLCEQESGAVTVFLKRKSKIDLKE